MTYEIGQQHTRFDRTVIVTAVYRQTYFDFFRTQLLSSSAKICLKASCVRDAISFRRYSLEACKSDGGSISSPLAIAASEMSIVLTCRPSTSDWVDINRVGREPPPRATRLAISHWPDVATRT